MAYAPNMTCHMQRCGTRPPSLTKQKRHPALQSRLGLSPPRLLGEHGHYVRQHHGILPAWQGGLRDCDASVIPNRGVRTAPAIARLASGVGGARAHRPLRPSARPSRDIPGTTLSARAICVQDVRAERGRDVAQVCVTLGR